MATAWRRTPRCAQGARLIEHGARFRRGTRTSGAGWPRRRTGVRAVFRAVTWCWAWRPGRWSCSPRPPTLDALYVPIGLGSGICGAIFARDLLGLKHRNRRRAKRRRRSYARSLAAGHVVGMNRADTWPTGWRCGSRMPRRLRSSGRGVADRAVRTSEIAAAIRAYWTDTHNLTEGAGAAPSRGVVRNARGWRRSGSAGDQRGNIDLDLFRSWVLEIRLDEGGDPRCGCR